LSSAEVASSPSPSPKPAPSKPLRLASAEQIRSRFKESGSFISQLLMYCHGCPKDLDAFFPEISVLILNFQPTNVDIFGLTASGKMRFPVDL
jgi:hypothetical protein